MRRDTPDGSRVRRLIRPPGAIVEARFLEACTRCGECADACPEVSIFKAGAEHGAALEMTPLLDLEERACYLCADVPCASACPSGALRPIEASEIKLGTAVLFPELCLNTLDRACTICVDVCPRPQVAIALPQDADGDPLRDASGALPIPRIDASNCTGCGLCVVHCGSYPKALAVTPEA